MAKADNKTRPTDTSVAEFLAAIVHPVRRDDAQALDALFQEVSGFAPQMWGASKVGYGAYDYVYASGRSGTFLATGFSPRKSDLSIYIMPGYQDYSALLARLGKHRKGAACLYINKLADIDMGVLRDLVSTGLSDLSRQ